MKYTIRGITDRTITFNSLGITVRGNCNNMVQYPHSIARGIDIKSEDQWNEINAMGKAGLIALEQEAVPVVKQKKAKVVAKPVKAVKTNKAAKSTKTEKTAKTTKATKATKPMKVVKRVAKFDDSSSDAVIVTPDGLITKNRMMKGSDFDLQESDITRASLEAAQQMADEERESNNQKPIDESKLDISERMGNDVVVSGDKGATKSKILRSALPPVKTDWIDLESALNDEDAKNAFVDKDDKADDKSDAFIE